MLRHIPRAPKKIASTALKELLLTHGHDIDVRSIQRDLHKLTTIFPLIHDESRPIGWSFARDAPTFDVPGLDAHAAITLCLIESQLSHQLPRSTLSTLRPHIETAKNLLAHTAELGLPSWRDKVRVIPRGQATLPPTIAPEVLAAVYDALLFERRLVVDYRPRTKAASEREVHPLAVVYRDGIGYLVCTHDGYDDVRSLALHRCTKAQMLESARKKPKGFDLDRFIADGELSFRMGQEPVALVARFHPSASLSVIDTPLTKEQKVTVDDDGYALVEAVVEDTRVLRSFLLGFGGLVEVIRPKAIRKAMRETARDMARLYKK
jgi:predicted DNA-binding transcriptional regulator YafY